MTDRSAYRRLSGYYFFYFAFIGIFSPYWSLYLQLLGFDAREIAVLMSLLMVMRMFAPTVWGWLADRSGRRRWIVRLSADLSLLALAGVFLGSSFAWLFVVMAVMSFFWSASLPLVEATTFSILKDRTGDYGVIRVWGSVGFVVAVIGVGYFLDWAGVATLVWLALGAKLGIAVCARGVPEAAAVPQASDAGPAWRVLVRSDVLAFFAACFLMAAAHGAYYTFYSIYLVDHGYDKADVGWLWALGVVFEIVVFLQLPQLMRRFTIRQILIVSFACAVVRFVVIGWAVESVLLLVLAQVLHAATFGSYHAAAVAAVHDYFRGRHQAQGQALYTSLSFGAGGALGAVASGYTWEALGPALTFTSGSVAALIGLVLILWRVHPAPQSALATRPAGAADESIVG
jgi:PPP family 3-phenylpropionic acid transporter